MSRPLRRTAPKQLRPQLQLISSLMGAPKFQPSPRQMDIRPRLYRQCVTSRNRSIHFSLFYPMLTFSLRLMVTHRLDSCDHLLYRLVTRYVPCLYCCRDSIVPCDLLSHVDGL